MATGTKYRCEKKGAGGGEFIFFWTQTRVQLRKKKKREGGPPPQGQKFLEPQHPGFPRGPPPWY